MQDIMTESPLITLGIPSGLFALLISLGGYVWRASARVTIAETNIVNHADRLKDHKEAMAKELADAEKAVVARDDQRKAEIVDMKKGLADLSVRHESAAIAMGQFREYVAQTLVTEVKLRDTEQRLSQQIKESREASGTQIMDLGRQIDRILSDRAARRGASA